MKRQVIVTTDNTKRGVFYGTLENEVGEKVILTDARMIVYWSSPTKGVLGLAAHGPKAGSRVTPVVPRIELEGKTAIIDCTEEAVKAFEGDIWD